MASLPHQERANLSTSFSETPRHRLLEFGDGYIQRTPIGIHQTRRRITITHSAMDLQEGDDVVDFYESRLNDGAAIDIASNYLFHRAGKFYLESFEVSMDDDARRSISASMIEVFDL